MQPIGLSVRPPLPPGVNAFEREIEYLAGGVNVVVGDRSHPANHPSIHCSVAWWRLIMHTSHSRSDRSGGVRSLSGSVGRSV